MSKYEGNGGVNSFSSLDRGLTGVSRVYKHSHPATMSIVLRQYPQAIHSSVFAYSGQGRQGRAGQGRAGPGKAGQGRAGPGRAGPGKSRPGKALSDPLCVLHSFCLQVGHSV